MTSISIQQMQNSSDAQQIEITRYLCAAAHRDEEFRKYVIKNIVEEEHKSFGDAHGIDIISVVKSCLAAQNRSLPYNIASDAIAKVVE